MPSTRALPGSRATQYIYKIGYFVRNLNLEWSARIFNRVKWARPVKEKCGTNAFKRRAHVTEKKNCNILSYGIRYGTPILFSDELELLWGCRLTPGFRASLICITTDPTLSEDDISILPGLWLVFCDVRTRKIWGVAGARWS